LALFTKQKEDELRQLHSQQESIIRLKAEFGEVQTSNTLKEQQFLDAEKLRIDNEREEKMRSILVRFTTQKTAME
jgi:hypothetical protein